MESFGSLLFAMGAGAPGLDFVADLPPEVSQRIFGYLDAASLVTAVRVSRRWMAACRGDPILRRRARRHIRRENRRANRGGLSAPAQRRGKTQIHESATLPLFQASFKVGPAAVRVKSSHVSRVNRSPKSGSTTRTSLRM